MLRMVKAMAACNGGHQFNFCLRPRVRLGLHTLTAPSERHTHTMQCADGDLCKLPVGALGPTGTHNCQGGRGGRIHSGRGEVEEPDGSEIHSICHSSATKDDADFPTSPESTQAQREVEGGLLAPGM